MFAEPGGMSVYSLWEAKRQVLKLFRHFRRKQVFLENKKKSILTTAYRDCPCNLNMLRTNIAKHFICDWHFYLLPLYALTPDQHRWWSQLEIIFSLGRIHFEKVVNLEYSLRIFRL